MKASIVYWLGENLYLNITNKCSNRCYFCIKNFTNGIAGFNLKLNHEPASAEVIRQLANYINQKHWKEIVFCGFGEPTANLDCLLEVARWISRYHTVPIRVDTNGHGYLLNPKREVIKEMQDAGVSKISVSLNAANKENYNEICKPIFENAFEETLKFIKKAKKYFKVEVTAVKIPELNIEEFMKLADSLGVSVRLRSYIHPFY